MRKDPRLSEKCFVHGPLFSESNVTIGAVEVFPHVYFGMHSYMVSGIIRSYTEIGRYCAIGRYVTIGAGEHNIEALSISGSLSLKADLKSSRQVDDRKDAKQAEGRPDRRVVIGHDVWIGDKVTILSGVTIHTGAVIGSNAVISRDVPPYTIVAGVPARPLRRRFSEAVSERLLASRWWEIDPAAMKGLDENDIEACLTSFETEDYPRIFAAPSWEVYERQEDFQSIRKELQSLRSEVNELKAKLASAGHKRGPSDATALQGGSGSKSLIYNRFFDLVVTIGSEVTAALADITTSAHKPKIALENDDFPLLLKAISDEAECHDNPSIDAILKSLGLKQSVCFLACQAGRNDADDQLVFERWTELGAAIAEHFPQSDSEIFVQHSSNLRPKALQNMTIVYSSPDTLRQKLPQHLSKMNFR